MDDITTRQGNDTPSTAQFTRISIPPGTFALARRSICLSVLALTAIVSFHFWLPGTEVATVCKTTAHSAASPSGSSWYVIETNAGTDVVNVSISHLRLDPSKLGNLIKVGKTYRFTSYGVNLPGILPQLRRNILSATVIENAKPFKCDRSIPQ